jgi:hypothetical protein
MSRRSDLWLGVNTVTKSVRGIVLDGFVRKSRGSSLSVKLLVPTDGSTPQILHQAPWDGVLPGHEVLEFCDHAVNYAHLWLRKYKLLENTISRPPMIGVSMGHFGNMNVPSDRRHWACMQSSTGGRERS